MYIKALRTVFYAKSIKVLRTVPVPINTHYRLAITSLPLSSLTCRSLLHLLHASTFATQDKSQDGFSCFDPITGIPLHLTQALHQGLLHMGQDPSLSALLSLHWSPFCSSTHQTPPTSGHLHMQIPLPWTLFLLLCIVALSVLMIKIIFLERASLTILKWKGKKSQAERLSLGPGANHSWKHLPRTVESWGHFPQLPCCGASVGGVLGSVKNQEAWAQALVTPPL